MNNDTITAIITAYGESGVGVIRISGKNSLDILRKIFVSKTGAFVEHRKVIYGNIRDPKAKDFLDEVMVTYLQGPYTFTGEDVVEISCHGSMFVLRKVLNLIISFGARLAEPGEFTKRAFLSGRMDLAQAESVMDLVRAKTEKSYEIALNQSVGNLSSRINEIRKRILNILTNMAVNLEYPDEDIDTITHGDLTKYMSQVDVMIDKLLDTASTGRILREGLNVAIVGKPNVGKSSLLNALIRETRAIVTEIPGTTRDTIEEIINIKNIPVKLVDTAGIRITEDKIEKIGIEKSKDSIQKSDLVILVLDGSKELSDEDEEIIKHLENKKVIALVNKIDLDKVIDEDAVKKLLPDAIIIETSVTNEIGIDTLENTIVDLVYGDKVNQNNYLMVSNIRHIELLQNAKKHLVQAMEMADSKEPMDLIETELREMYEDMNGITGNSVSDEIINEVFSRFCLGK